MKLKYGDGDGDVEIEISDAEIACLKAYAIGVLLKMQEADVEYGGYWTACSISFSDLTPEFHWSSIEDMDRSHPIQIEQPVSSPQGAIRE